MTEIFKPEVDRRTLLRRAAAVGLLATPAVTMLSACVGSGNDDKDDNADKPAGAVSATNPLGIKEDAPLEIVIFNGGLGTKYATDVHIPSYNKLFPNSKVTFNQTEEIATVVQPRFTAGNPPDMINNSGSKLMDQGALVQAGQVQDLTDLFAAPSVDIAGKTVKDTLIPGTIEQGSFNGKPYVLNYAFTVFGLWYSGKLFKDNGWTPPTTWADFTALLDKMKAKGLTPFGYAGANAPYYMYTLLLTSAAKIGGADILKNIDNLEDGAWTNDAVKQAATAWAEVGAKYMDKSFEGLRHTDVQLQQNQYKLAYYPSGDWLENEQKKDAPADFTYQLTPIPAKGKLGAKAVRANAGEGYVVPEKAKNKAGGMEYLRLMLSKEGAKGFADLIKSPTVVVGGSEGVTFPPGVTSSAAALKAAGSEVVNYFWDGDYKDLDQECRTATNALMFGRENADQFCERMQKKADAIKNDSSVKKYKR